MNFPAELKYSKDHEWVKIDGDVAYIGITEFAQGELGDIVFVDVNTIGKTVKQFELFGSIEAVKTVSDLFLPVGGTILELNNALNNNPELVNSDSYGKGWMVKIKLTDAKDLDNLMDSVAYAKMVGH